jgi:hypothetical protein
MCVPMVTTTSAISAVDVEKTRKERERQLKTLNEKEINFKLVVDANKSFLKSQVGPSHYSREDTSSSSNTVYVENIRE